MKLNIVLVTANGGHLVELNELKEVYEKYNGFYITYKGPDTEKLANAYYYRDYKSVIMKMLIQLTTVWYILLKEKPNLLISTGGAIAIPVSFYAKLLNIHIIYIDSATCIQKRSGTGKIMFDLADLFLTNWPKMAEKYGKKAKYWGSII